MNKEIQKAKNGESYEVCCIEKDLWTYWPINCPTKKISSLCFTSKAKLINYLKNSDDPKVIYHPSI